MSVELASRDPYRVLPLLLGRVLTFEVMGKREGVSRIRPVLADDEKAAIARELQKLAQLPAATRSRKGKPRRRPGSGSRGSRSA